MTTFNRKRLTSVLWSVWLVILAIIQSNVTAVPSGLISEFRLPTTFIYDGRNQTTVAYDSSGKSADGYDVGAVLTRYEKRDRMTGDGASFAKIAELLAAEGGTTLDQLSAAANRAAQSVGSGSGPSRGHQGVS